ncbi:MAG TPA: hypothetical protein DCL43_02930 [Chitinophagaceae bacterium]|nr:hypothetical protein [Chitinophagaceae bacterium]HAN38318.1 hypothetical protein [Chitinophagaceae bacterium]
MEILLLVVITILLSLILIRSFRTEHSNNSNDIQALTEQVKYLQRKIDNLSHELKRPTSPSAPSSNQSVKAPPPVITEDKKVMEPPVVLATAAKEEHNFTVKDTTPVEPKEPLPKVTLQAPVSQQHTSWLEQWMQQNPDVEKFIGENLANKIGIAVLVLGIGFFVKYAIDNNWINEVGRVAIGILCGGLLMGIAHYLHERYRSFSSVLVGGGIAVLYFTIGLAFHDYQLFPQSVAFILMIAITAIAVVFATLYNRVELAVIATLGAYATPFMVSTGSGNYIIFCTYLCIISIGLTWLAYLRNWRIVHFVAFAANTINFLLWLFVRYDYAEHHLLITMLFISAFYTIFLTMNTIHHVTKASPLKAADFVNLVAVNAVCLGSGLYVLDESNLDIWKGLYTAVLAVVNLVIAYQFIRSEQVDKRFIFLLIGITVSLVSLAAPIQLNGHFISIFWATEMVLLLWLYQKAGFKLLQQFSLLVGILAIISVLMDISYLYYDTTNAILPILINKAFITVAYVGICFGVVARVYPKDDVTVVIAKNRYWRLHHTVLAAIIISAAGAFEIQYQAVQRLPNTNINYLLLQGYWAAVLCFITLRLRQYKIHYPQFIIAISVVGLLYLVNIYRINMAMRYILTAQQSIIFLGVYWLGMLALLISLVQWAQYFTVRNIVTPKVEMAIIATIMAVLILSQELKWVYTAIAYNLQDDIFDYTAMYGKAGLSIVWGALAFVIIWLGIKHAIKPLRVLALILFSITLVKLFAYDISNVAPAGKIIAFILLGVLLLAISFMYQRLKRVLLSDEKDITATP